MIRMIKHPLLLVSGLLWIGFVGAISFMEAWLKFQAEGVTLPIGLSIGKLIFFALNKVEWVLALTIIAYLFYYRQINIGCSIWLKIPLAILITQTFYFLPELDKQAAIIISGGEAEQSYIHIYYVVLEVIKMIALIMYTNKAFSKIPNTIKSIL